MNKYEIEIRQKIDAHWLKYQENPNVVFLDEDVFYHLRCQKLINSNNTIMGLSIIKTCQEHDFIHVSRIEQ